MQNNRYSILHDTSECLALMPPQILSLFRGYDMSWPHSTSKVLAWAGALNVSIALTAPEVGQNTHTPCPNNQVSPSLRNSSSRKPPMHLIYKIS